MRDGTPCLKPTPTLRSNLSRVLEEPDLTQMDDGNPCLKPTLNLSSPNDSPMVNKLRFHQKQCPSLTAPIRRVEQVIVGPDGCPKREELFQHVPFTSTDLLNWKHQYGLYSQKPQEITELIRTIMRTHSPNWTDIQQLMATMFNPEEREKIRWAVGKIMKDRLPTDRSLATHLERRYPSEDPE